VPTFTIAKDVLAKGPGTLFWAPPLTALPDYTVSGSSTYGGSSTWTGWFQLNITIAGSVWSYDVKNEAIQAEEYLDDIDQADVGREAFVEFELMRMTATNLARLLNRPTPTISGSGATQNTTVRPPGLGAGLYCMIGWQATDDGERIVAENAYQIGGLKVNRRKGAKVASLNAQYKLFPNASGDPWRHDFAGNTRA
jgi:hypothetical protein